MGRYATRFRFRTLLTLDSKKINVIEADVYRTGFPGKGFKTYYPS